MTQILQPQQHRFCGGQSLQIANVCLWLLILILHLSYNPSLRFSMKEAVKHISLFFWHFQSMLFLRSLFCLSLSTQSSLLQCLPIFVLLFLNLVPVNILQTFSEVAFGTGIFFYYNLKLSYLSHLFYKTVMRVLKRDSIFAVFQKCLLCCILFRNTLCIVPLISKGQMLIAGFSALHFH